LPSYTFSSAFSLQNTLFNALFSTFERKKKQ